MKDQGPESTPATPAIATTVITGYAGAGKSTALNVLEDEGHYCVENLPAFLLPELVNGLAARNDHGGRLAVVMDSRDADFPREFQAIFARLQAAARPLTLVFLEASEEVLLRRYSQMRRVHPRAGGDPVREGIRREREELRVLRQAADRIVDTSALTPHQLRLHLLEQLGGPGRRPLRISFTSFGFKHGPPVEADLLFDVRFLPNPYFVPEMSGRTGLEPEVAAYVLDNEAARRFLDLVRPLLAFLIPQYRQEGKTYLTVGIGCTGGRHRSVAMTEKLAKLTGAVAGETIRICHRDLERG
jgi:RNase adapter protein RapZ